MAAVGGAPGIINGALPNGNAGTGEATFALINTGEFNISGQSDAPWVAPQDSKVAAFYQVKVDNTGGASFASGTTGTWLDMSSTRIWTVADGSGTAIFTVSFREKTTGIARGTQAGVTLSA